jgi:hypothetical protein
VGSFTGVLPFHSGVAGHDLEGVEVRPDTVRETLEVARAISERPDARDGGSAWWGSPPAPRSPSAAAAITQSLVSTLPPSRERERLLAELEEVDRLRPQFLADLRGMGAEARSVAELLENNIPDRFDDLYAGLPYGVRAKMEELSPRGRQRGARSRGAQLLGPVPPGATRHRRLRGPLPAREAALETAERPVQKLEKALPVELHPDLCVGRSARDAVEVADGLPAGQLALALDVDPHRARLQ